MGHDARVHATLLGDGRTAELALAPGRHAWVQVARGAVEVNGTRLEDGDGAAISEEARLALTGRGAEEAEVLVFDLA
jgi:redox-sensitive bicupin YhaK (pirin superfamily)